MYVQGPYFGFVAGTQTVIVSNPMYTPDETVIHSITERVWSPERMVGQFSRLLSVDEFTCRRNVLTKDDMDNVLSHHFHDELCIFWTEVDPIRSRKSECDVCFGAVHMLELDPTGCLWGQVSLFVGSNSEMVSLASRYVSNVMTRAGV